MTLSKAQIRAEMLNWREKRSRYEIDILSGFIFENLVDTLGAIKPKIVALYQPIRGEVDLTTKISKFVAMGTKLCLPQGISKNSPLVFNLWNGEQCTQKDIFGMPCASGNEVIPDIVIVPLVAFDSYCYRIGYGGGCYDRTFTKLPNIYKIGVAYSFQEVGAGIPSENHDISMDIIITESGTIEP